MIKYIVCAIDGSDHSDKAVELASDLAARYDAKLCLVHVFMRGMSHDQLDRFDEHAHLKDIVAQERERVAQFIESVVGVIDGVYIPPPSAETITRVAEVIVEDARQIAASQVGTNLSTMTVDGKPAEQILKCAQDNQADMIVMGSRGLGGLRSLLLGSTSHEVSHLAPCTCITVK